MFDPLLLAPCLHRHTRALNREALHIPAPRPSTTCCALFSFAARSHFAHSGFFRCLRQPSFMSSTPAGLPHHIGPLLASLVKPPPQQRWK